MTEVGLKLTLVPDGWPVALKLTVWAVPERTAVPIVEVPLAPCCTVRLLGVAVIAKSNGVAAVTLSVTGVVCVALALVPVTVIVYVPVAVSEPTAMFIVEEPPAVTDVGLNETVTPDGSPVALRVTD